MAQPTLPESFRTDVAARIAVHVLAQRPIQDLGPSSPSGIRLESGSEADDIEMTMSGGGTAWIQAKRRLGLSVSRERPLASAFDQLVRQYVRTSAIDPSRDRLVVAYESGSEPITVLRAVIRRFRGDCPTREQAAPDAQSQRFLEKLEQIITIAWQDADGSSPNWSLKSRLLSLIVFWELKEGDDGRVEVDPNNLLTSVVEDNETAAAANALRVFVSNLAKDRRGTNTNGLRGVLRDAGIALRDKRSERHAPRFKRSVIGGSAVLVVGTIGALVATSNESPTCPEKMVPVPANVFWMGSPPGIGSNDEHPKHQFNLKAYCIGEKEVTVEDYAKCVAHGRCLPPSHTVDTDGGSASYRTDISQLCNGDDRPKHPINCIDWYEARIYCEWLDMRLPTEEEWEYAARGDHMFTYPWGNSPPNAVRLNACGTECTPMAQRQSNQGQPVPSQSGAKKMYDTDDGWLTTAPVGSFPDGRSPFGALDMAGNVWEWTESPYVGYSQAAVLNPSDADTSSWRVLRGGGWQATDPNGVRAAIRLGARPSIRNTDFGFRCAKNFP